MCSRTLFQFTACCPLGWGGRGLVAVGGVQPLDPVDLQGEVGGGLEVGLVESAVEHGLLGVGGEVAVGIQSEGVGDGLTLDGELAGIKDLQSAVLQSLPTSATFSAVPLAQIFSFRVVMTTEPSAMPLHQS